MTDKQRAKLMALCEGHGVEFNENNYRRSYDLPADYVAGWVGPVFYGVDANGVASS